MVIVILELITLSSCELLKRSQPCLAATLSYAISAYCLLRIIKIGKTLKKILIIAILIS